MDSQTKKQLGHFYRDGLLDDVLPFWMTHGLDKENGGVFTSLDRQGVIVETDKSVWQQGRFTWLLGELINHPLLVDHPSRDEWLQTAERNLAFISQHCFDPSDGRMWFHVTADGRPIRKRRYAYSESFAAIAFGELTKATGNSQHAARAKQCFDEFVRQSNSPTDFPAKFTSTRPSKGIGFPMIVLNTAAELRDSIGLETAEVTIQQAIEEIERDFCRPEIECVMELVSADGSMQLDHFDGRTLNPGHAIEAAWFIMNEGHFRNKSEWIQLGCQMLDWMWNRGWDREFGGLLYFTSADERPIQEYWQDMKFWWPHNELLIATLMAHQLTGDAKYWQWHELAREWSFGKFADPEFGEWFGYLRRDGAISNPLKGNLWKGPFHLPRMQLKCWELLASN